MRRKSFSNYKTILTNGILMRTGKGDAPGMGFPTARRRELYTGAAFGRQKMASHQ